MVEYGSMQHKPNKEAAGALRSSVEIMADINALGAMLPGSVRRSFGRRKLKSGKVVTDEKQPIYTTWDPVRKRQVSKRIPKDCFEAVRAMTEERRRLDTLVAELDAAMLRENMPDGDSKKKPSWHGRAPRTRRG